MEQPQPQYNKPKTELNPYCIIILSRNLGQFFLFVSFPHQFSKQNNSNSFAVHYSPTKLSHPILSNRTLHTKSPLHLIPSIHPMIPILPYPILSYRIPHPALLPPPTSHHRFHLPSSTHSCLSSWLLNHFEIGMAFQMTPVSCCAVHVKQSYPCYLSMFRGFF